MTARTKDRYSCIIGNVISCILLVIVIIINAVAVCGYNWWNAMLEQSVWLVVVAAVWHVVAIGSSISVLIVSNTLVTVDENGITEKLLSRTLHRLSWKDVKRIEIVWVNARAPRLIINVMSENKESYVSKHNFMLESTKKRITFLYRGALISEIKRYYDGWIYGWDQTLNYEEEGKFRS